MKLWTSQHVFQHCWEKVTQAAWRKYPNELNPGVKTIDILDRYVDSEGKLHTKRLIGTDGFLPAWVNRMFGLDDLAYAVEESVVDPNDKTMSLHSKNWSLSNWCTVEETLVYSQDPEKEDVTNLNQEAVIKVFGISFGEHFEGMIKSAMASNAGKGRQAMENVIGVINKEIQDIATNLEQATVRINSEFEQAKQGLEQAARIPQAMCEGKS
nr:slowmo-like 2 [Haliclona caerulea]